MRDIEASVSLYKTLETGLVAYDGKLISFLDTESSEFAFFSSPAGPYTIYIYLGGTVSKCEVAIGFKIPAGVFLCALGHLTGNPVICGLVVSKCTETGEINVSHRRNSLNSGIHKLSLAII